MLFEDLSGAGNLSPLPLNCDPLPSYFVGDEVQVVGFGGASERDSSNTYRWWAVEEAVNLTSTDFTLDGYGEQGVCFGDSGGPALWTTGGSDVRVVGVLSWGDSACGHQDRYARVDQHCAFIRQFFVEQAAAILQLVNSASERELDEDVGLDSRAAANIVAARSIE